MGLISINQTFRIRQFNYFSTACYCFFPKPLGTLFEKLHASRSIKPWFVFILFNLVKGIFLIKILPSLGCNVIFSPKNALHFWPHCPVFGTGNWQELILNQWLQKTYSGIAKTALARETFRASLGKHTSYAALPKGNFIYYNGCCEHIHGLVVKNKQFPAHLRLVLYFYAYIKQKLPARQVSEINFPLI